MLEAQVAAVSQKSTIAEAIRYALTRWPGPTPRRDDGVEIDSNVVERTIRPLALNRKRAAHKFRGGGEHRAIQSTASMNYSRGVGRRLIRSKGPPA
jgi:hypothetical protein